MANSHNNLLRENVKFEWLPAIMISFAYICTALSVSGVSIVLSFIIILTVIYKIYNKSYIISERFIWIVITILCMFMVSFVRLVNNEFTVEYIERFIFYDIVALFIGMQSFDKKNALKMTTFIGLLFLPLVLMKDFMAENTSMAMGASYACLPILVSAILFYDIEKKLVYKFISIIVIFGIMTKYITMANRGIWLVLIMMIYIFFYYKISMIVTKKKRLFGYISLFVIAALICEISLNFEELINLLSYYTEQKIGIQVYALWKMSLYLDKDDLLNGRDDLYLLAIDCAKENYIIGNGIGYFESLIGGYCHNIFLQLINEGGMLFFLPIAYYIIKVIRNIYFYITEGKIVLEIYVWNILTFCCGIIPFFVSSCHWIYPLFWFLWGSFLQKKDYYDIRDNLNDKG